jgi:hypothetical protein
MQNRGEHVLRGRSESVRIWTRADRDPTLAAEELDHVAR